jgi:hypothetical protein
MEKALKKYKLIELYGHCEAQFTLVDPAFNLDIDNDEMLNIEWENEPLEWHMFFGIPKFLKFCQDNDVEITETYWGKIY